VIAVVVHRELAEAHAVEHAEVAAGAAQVRPDARIGLFRAALVDEDAYLHAFARTFRQRLGDTVAHRPVAPEERLDVDVVRRPLDVGDELVEERAVLDDLRAVAVDDVTSRQRGERVEQIRDPDVRRNDEVDMTPARFPPDDVSEQNGSKRESNCYPQTQTSFSVAKALHC